MKPIMLMFVAIPLLMTAAPVEPKPVAFPEGNYVNFDWDTFENWSAARARIDANSVDYSLLQAAIFFYTNQFRASKNLKPLAYQPNLSKASQYHTRQMGDKHFYDHINRVNRNMRTALDRARNFGFLGGAVGENIALEFLLDYKAEASYWHQTTPNGIKYYYGDSGSNKGYIPAHTYLSLGKSIVLAWINSPGHRANMLNKEFKFLGVGVCLEPETQGNANIPRIFAAQLFGG